MSQITFTSLTVLSNENAISENIDFSSLIQEFADKKIKKVTL